MLKYQRRLINSKIMAGTICIFILILFTSGCVSDSTIPGIDPNPVVNPDNSTVSYVKVSASSSTIKIIISNNIDLFWYFTFLYSPLNQLY